MVGSLKSMRMVSADKAVVQVREKCCSVESVYAFCETKNGSDSRTASKDAV